MQDDYSDILGTGALNVKPKPSIPFSVKATFLFFVLLILYLVGLNLWSKFLKWRERSYRLAMRRKHGIPDDDHRPFNVAYAAVQRARQEREALRSAKSRPVNNMPREQPRPSAQLGQDLRQRTGIGRNVETARMGDRIGVLPGAYRQSPPQNLTPGLSRYSQIISGQSAIHLDDEKVIYPRATELVSQTNYNPQGSARVLRGQKGYDGDARKRGHIYMDVDEGPVVTENISPKRGSKREFGDADETEDVLASKRAREKRARKISLEKALPDEEMEVDENELEDGADRGHSSRGKKRDRDEAGSTFGYDDEDQSELEDIQDDDETRPRSRKRRSVVKKKSDLAVAMRGKKRDRDIDDELSEDADDQASNQISSRKRRNRREGRLGEYVTEDISMDDLAVKGKPRKIGEEWTSNGVIYRIGPNGQRLRQALVKRARQKYSMPEDSQHPDRDANLEVYVETWLNENEYHDAKERHLLAWQDSPKASAERGSHSDHTQPPPSPSGKSLLWKSPAMSTPEGGSPTSEVAPITALKGKGKVTHDSRRQSIAVDVAMRVNPFQQYPSQSNRRIASGSSRVSSVSSTSSPGLVDSTNSSPRSVHRLYSKWEKQDLEANAMMKMREAARKKEAEEKERLEKERLEKERAEREKAEKVKAAAAPPVPTITVTKPPEDKPVPAEQKVPDFFAKQAEPVKEAIKPAVQPSPFSFKAPEEKPATSAANAAPLFPGAAPAATPTPPFSFNKPGPTSFMHPAKPAEDNGKSSEQKPKPTPFVIPQSPAGGAPISSPVPAAPTGSFFSIPKPVLQPEQKKPESSGQASSASLLSRMGGMTDTGASSSTPSTFSFTKPSEAPKSFFATTSIAPSAPTTQPTQPQPTATTASAPMKFDFKFQNKPVAPTPTPLTLPTSSPSPAITPDVAKPAVPPTFTFKPLTATPDAAAAPSTIIPPAPGVSQFTFGVSSGTLQAPGDVKKDNTTPLFGFPSTNTTTSNGSASGGAGFFGFGNNPTQGTATSDSSSKPSLFGTGSGTSTNIFGAGGKSSFETKPAEPSTGMFIFAQNPATTTNDGAKNLFSLGNTAQTVATATPTIPKSPFGASDSLNKTSAAEGTAAAFVAAPTDNKLASSMFRNGGTGVSSSFSSFGATSGTGQSFFTFPSGTSGKLESTPFSLNPSTSGGVGNVSGATTFGFSSGQSAFGSTTSTQSAFKPSSGMFSFGSTTPSAETSALQNTAGPQSSTQSMLGSTSTESSTTSAQASFGSKPSTIPFSFGLNTNNSNSS